MDTEELLVHCYDWRDTTENGTKAIHGWCLNKNSEKTLIRVLNFPLMFRVELPGFILNRKYNWNQESANRFIEVIKSRVAYSDESHVATTTYFCYMNSVYYNKQIPIITMTFDSAEAMRHNMNTIRKEIKTSEWGAVTCKIHEEKITSVRKMITLIGHKRGVMFRYCQWFKCIGQKTLDNISRCENEYIIKWEDIVPIAATETSDWDAVPGILSWDIEVYSDNPNIFPDEHNAKHVAYMISGVYKKGKGEIKRYGIIIGECNQITKDKFPNCILYSVNSEKELVDKFADIVIETDPEVLTGYNIFSFDYKYLDFRLKRMTFDWPNMSCLHSYTSIMEKINWKSSAYGSQQLNILDCPGRISVDLLPIVRRDYKLSTYSLNSVCDNFNLGKSKMDVSAAEMFKIFERLTDARKNKEKNQEEFKNAIEQTTKVMEYCIRDSELVLDLMEKLNTWVGLIEMANICGVNIITLFTRGQQIRCVAQLYDLAYKNGFVVNSRESQIFTYIGALVHEPIPGEFENVVCLDFSSLYPSIIRAYNISYDTFIPLGEEVGLSPNDYTEIKFTQKEPTIVYKQSAKFDDSEVDLETVYKDQIEDEDDEENQEKTPKAKFFEKEYTFRFSNKKKGLLPQLVENLVMERKAVNREIRKLEAESSILKKYVNLLKACNANKIQNSNSILQLIEKKKEDIDNNFKLSEYYSVALNLSLANEQNFDQYYKLLQDLINQCSPYSERISYLALMEVVLDKRQLGLKVSANSFYGFLGVQNGGKMPLIEAAMCVTAKGRELITHAKVYVEKMYDGIIVAGDTDSVMMTLNKYITDSSQCDYWGRRLAQEISGIGPGEKDVDGNIQNEGKKGLFPPPLTMEFEKAMRMVVFKKKKYAAYYIGKNGKYKTKEILDEYGQVIGTKNELLVRGIILARRDNCKFVTNLYTKILYNVLDKKPSKESFKLLFDNINNLRNGTIPIEEFIIIKGYTDSYKSENYSMKLFGEYLKAIGLPAQPGERLGYVVVDIPGEEKLGNKMRLVSQYIDSQKTSNPYKIDTLYYIDKALRGPIDQLFEVGYKNEISKIKLKYEKGKKIYSLLNPVELVVKVLTDKKSNLEKNQDLFFIERISLK